MINRTHSLIVSLLRASLTSDGLEDRSIKDLLPQNNDELNTVLLSAGKQGVAALVGDQMLQLPQEWLKYVPKGIAFFQMIGIVYNVRQNYNKQYNIASTFARTLNKKGANCLILKGMSFSTYYNDPTLRECGDCDCYLGDSFEVGNTTAVELGGNVDFGTYKHSHIYLNGFMIENHKYLTEFNNTKRGEKTERILQEAIKRDGGKGINDSYMICPNSHFNALFLVKHALDDFLAGGITLRMLYDWAVLLRAEQSKLNWSEIYADMKACGIKRFADLMTAVCIKYFGLHKTEPNLDYCDNQALVDELMEDTLYHGFHFYPHETLVHKVMRIIKRFGRMWHYRRLASERVPIMIWNSFAFSSYLHRDIELKQE